MNHYCCNTTSTIFANPNRGALNSPDPQIYLGFMVEIWACLGLDFAIFPIFYFFLSLFMCEHCLIVTLCNSSLGSTKSFNTPLNPNTYTKGTELKRLN